MSPSVHPPRTIILPMLLSGLLLSTLACSSFSPPGAAPTATETTIPTDTPTIHMTPTAGPTLAPEEWPVVFSDTFEKDSGAWFVGSDEDEYAVTKYSITDGFYLLELTAKQDAISWITPDLGELEDFRVSAEITKKSGTNNFDYGLVFRLDEDYNYYYFELYPTTQEYDVYLWADGEWTEIMDWTVSDAIQARGTNRLEVLGVGSSFTLFINGEEVDSFTDETLTRGEVGIAAGVGEAGDSLKIGIDNFEVKAPEKPD